MNNNQNKKIAQITSQTLIVGVDIAKFKHVARAQDFRLARAYAHLETKLGCLKSNLLTFRQNEK
ncbi:hypothetical protein J6TS2_42470 [Heyndrickxia sporothermodurans]|nr:hypothetical protein J6TS2_42470 [Heyndrickxia sporothermodurans]